MGFFSRCRMLGAEVNRPEPPPSNVKRVPQMDWDRRCMIRAEGAASAAACYKDTEAAAALYLNPPYPLDRSTQDSCYFWDGWHAELTRQLEAGQKAKMYEDTVRVYANMMRIRRHRRTTITIKREDV